MSSLDNYQSQKQFLQNFHITAKAGEYRPFVYVKNHKCACTAVISTLINELTLIHPNAVPKDIKMGLVNTPPANLLKAGPRQLKLDQAIDAINDEKNYRFTVIREPKSRTISAFADKILTRRQYKRMFMNYLNRPIDSEISLSSFLDIIANDPKALDLDRHWRPQRKEISYDHFTYDYIGNTSSLDASMAHITKSIFGKEVPIFENHNALGHKSSNIELIQDMTAKDVRNLEKALEIDFEMYEEIESNRGTTNAYIPIQRPPIIPVIESKVATQAADKKEEFKEGLREIGKRDGFFEEIGTKHSGLYIKQGSTLIVTFENLDHVERGDGERMPWGYEFVKKQGWSMLGMMAHGWTWYRDEAVFDFFDRLRDEKFFDQFENVVFYGASMGGYAASVFSAAVPGSKVILISPQATIDPKRVPWENRYPKAKNQPFDGRYSYGPDMIKSASKAFVFIDPHQKLDKKHANLFDPSDIEIYHSFYCGHRIASLWQQFGMLKPVILECVDGSLTKKSFYHMLRARKDNRRYQREMLTRLEKKGRDKLVIQYCTAVLARGHGPFFQKALNAAKKRIKLKG